MKPSKRLKYICDLYDEEIENACNPTEMRRKTDAKYTACIALIGEVLDELEK